MSGSTRVGTIANVPTELVGSATLAYVAVIASLFLMPVMSARKQRVGIAIQAARIRRDY